MKKRKKNKKVKNKGGENQQQNQRQRKKKKKNRRTKKSEVHRKGEDYPFPLLLALFFLQFTQCLSRPFDIFVTMLI